MKLDSYWTDSAPAFEPEARELPAQVDVAIVGGGFTGLSAALALARRGASVAVLEAGSRVASRGLGRSEKVYRLRHRDRHGRGEKPLIRKTLRRTFAKRFFAQKPFI